VVIAVVVWLIVRGGDDNGNKNSSGQLTQPVPRVPGVPPVSLDAASLKNFVQSQGHPVYWVGARQDRNYEVTRTSDGSVYIRYLPKNVKAGDRRPAFLTVGTYPNNDPEKSVRNGSKRRGFGLITVAGGHALTNSNPPARSVYVAYSGSKYLVEVWDPSPGRSLDLVRSGAVTPVR
jgi:hypothetical protein